MLTMGLSAGSKCRVLRLICVILIMLVSLVTGQLGWAKMPPDKTLPEDTPVGTIIGSFRLENGSSLMITSGAGNPYVRLSETSRGTQFLEVDIILNKELDYDYGQKQMSFSYRGEGTNGGQTEFVTWIQHLFVTNVNDVTPRLINQPYSVNVPENQARNTAVYDQIAAEDDDMNDRKTYTLTASPQTTDKDTFSIDSSTGQLILTRDLNFESIRFYQYTVTVTDKVGHNDSAELFITVTDVQDTPPYFTGEPFQASVWENASIGTSLITVSAADGDRGLSNGVTLNITNENCKGLFHVDPISGVVNLISQADRDTGEVSSQSGICTLVIQATEDNHYPQKVANAQTATTSVTITILDVNDNAPQFNKLSYIINVDENTQQGVPINFNTPITVTDLDQGSNAIFEVKVTKLEDYFEVTPTKVQSSGEILIRVKNSTILDYETNETLGITLEAKDTAGTSTATVTISINNINDNSPVFSNSTYHGIILENSQTGTSVITITATDADKIDGNHNYGVVKYTLEGQDKTFQIDNTGLITVNNGVLDRETKDTYYVTVVAEDGGHNKASAVLEIKILDENDELPQFVTNDYQASLKEQELNFMRPVTVHATDNDEPNSPNSQISYNIDSSLPLGLVTYFSLESSSGTLSVLLPLEYEKITFPPGEEGKITLTVKAVDGGTPKKESTVTVVVILQDMNNQQPNCTQLQYSTTVAENSSISSSIFQVNAIDKDGTEPNNMIMYSIDQTSAGKFLINSTSGVLSMRDTLDREDRDYYDILVTVTDLGVPPRTGSCKVSVTVSDINDTPPVFVQKFQTSSWTENTKGLSLNISADDKDSNNKLVYDVQWQNCTALDPSGQAVSQPNFQTWIAIDHVNGIITNTEKLDRETIETFTLVVQVMDMNSENGPQTDTATVTVHVDDENDERPEFSSTLYEGEIQENMPDGSKVQFSKSLSVTDKDKGTNSEFILKLLTHGDAFSVVPDKGTGQVQFSLNVTNSSLLNYEERQYITLEVMAIESNTAEIFSSTATVNISIINTNDNMPEFVGAPINAEVSENEPSGTFITNVMAIDADLGKYGTVVYSLPTNPPEFRIDQNTGQVFITQPLDREQQETYTVLVKASDIGNFASTTQLTITVKDVNDNCPQFSQNQPRNISENEPIFSPSLFVLATDGDAPGNNSKIKYSLLSSVPANIIHNFTINDVTSEITLASPLDYENLDRSVNGVIVLQIQAEDHGNPSKTNSTSITITVKDTNDMSPQFNQSTYTTNIPENIPAGSFVVAVNATDRDVSPSNNKVSYTLDISSANIFHIDGSSGQITVKSVLNREVISEYSIIVTAKDSGQPALTSTTFVTVNVTDVNDSPPTFTWDFKSISVAENSKAIIAQNIAEDPDDDPNLYYSISWSESSGMDGNERYVPGNSLQALVAINNATGEVYPINELDREKLQHLQLTLVVQDKNNIPGTKNNATAILTVLISDENDNPPIFDGNYFTATIQENMPKGSEIKMINTTALIITDADSGANSRYNITLENSSVFTIAPSEGDGSTSCVITVADSSILDYEKQQNISIKVIATEFGTLRSNSATVIIFIQNINDNFPKFNSSMFEVSIPEDSPIGYHITTLKANDADFGEFGIVHYIIDETTWFVIDSATGNVALNMFPLDREAKDSYTVVIKAKDTGGFEGSTQLTVTLTDVNDMKPQFLETSYAGEVKENDQFFKIPLIVKATDADAPNTENSKIYYSITSVPPVIGPNIFKIDNTSGEIKLSKALDYEDLIHKFPSGIFQLQVTATDCGIPSFNSNVLVNVTVTDANDESPEFDSKFYSGNLKENSPEGVVAITVSANDKDVTSPNKDLYYVIQSGSRDKLQIDSQSGNISVGTGAKLDRESTEENGFLLTVLAIDKGSPARTGIATVSITVLDVNDSPPEIAPINALFQIYENIPLHSEIAQFNATDKDEKSNLTFNVVWSESHAYDEKEKEVNASLLQKWLNINNKNGTITVKAEMDREQVEQMILKVVVVDQNAETGPQMATATVTLSLLDINDNSPKISTIGGVLHLNVSEGTKIGTEITTFTATDADRRQTVKFSMANTNSSFEVSDFGKLTLRKELDRETYPHLNFTVIATDDGSPALSSSVTVIIDVLDINDNDPEFVVEHSSQPKFYVLENSDNTTWVASMTATDKDAGDNGNVTFEFKDISPFVLDPITGSIYVSDKLDREATPSYALTVIAADNPLLESRRRTSLVITIEVDDVNDSPPVFSANAYEGAVSEKTNIGNLVPITPTIISATDKDVGNNSLVTFSLLGPSADFFSINPMSGEVFVNKNLMNNSGIYSYEVNATDHGSPVLWTVVNLTITILDENINPPVFVLKGPMPAIQECAGHGKSVYTFSATDADKDKSTNGKVKYFLDTSTGTGTNDSQLFDLDEDRGVLSTTTKNSNIQLFDNEKHSELVIQVLATDCGIPPFSVPSGLLRIKVTDINDNPPEFVPVPNTKFSVQEEKDNVIVGHVKAFDKDESADLTYKLSDIDQSWQDYFYIKDDPNDGGVIYVNKSLDHEEVNQIKMKVTAIDKSTFTQGAMCDGTVTAADSNSAPLEVIITIEDINDNPPVFVEKSLSLGFLSSTNFGEKIVSLQSHVTDKDTPPNSIHKFYQVGEIQPDKDISKTWTTNIKSDPVKVDINGTVTTNYKFSQDAYGYFSLQVLVNDSAGNDTLDLKIYVVGEFQVVHMTLWSTEDELRKIQDDLIQELNHIGYKFVPDNILPAYKDDGTVDNSRSVLVTHAVDADGNIVDGHALLNKLDTSPVSPDILNRYRVSKTVSGDQADKLTADNTEEKIRNILIGVIAVIAVTFIITLYLLIHNINRFKRKLKAATIEVHGTSPMKQDIFPGLDNENIKSANPIFNRDDLILDDSKFGDDYDRFNTNHSDTLSNGSQNSLDQNAINSADTREKAKTTIDEQEVTLDLYGNDETEAGTSALYSQFMYRHSDVLPHGSPNKEHRQGGSSNEGSDGDLEEAFNFSLSNFESTDI